MQWNIVAARSNCVEIILNKWNVLFVHCMHKSNHTVRRHTQLNIVSECSWPLIMCLFVFFSSFFMCLITQSVRINYQVCVISLLASAIQNNIQYDLITFTCSGCQCRCVHTMYTVHNVNVSTKNNLEKNVVFSCLFLSIFRTCHTS